MSFKFHLGYRKSLLALAGMLSTLGFCRSAQAGNAFVSRIGDLQDHVQLVADGPFHSSGYSTSYGALSSGAPKRPSFGNTRAPGFANSFSKAPSTTFGNTVREYRSGRHTYPTFSKFNKNT